MEAMELIKEIQDFASDINHYDSDDFTPPESVAEIFNDLDVTMWMDSMLKHCASLALGKLEEITEEESFFQGEEVSKLKPCPFCGEKAIDAGDREGNYEICCSGCPVFIVERTKDMAVTAWNKRAMTKTREVTNDVPMP